VNVGHDAEDIPDELRATATSIKIEGGRADGAGLLGAYLIALRSAYRDGFGFPAAILDRYRAISATLGRTVRATTVGGGQIEGEAIDIGEEGELIVRTSRGDHRVAFGEVEHLR